MKLHKEQTPVEPGGADWLLCGLGGFPSVDRIRASRSVHLHTFKVLNVCVKIKLTENKLVLL